ncbi:hypothetical protein RJ639_012460, partial [Escallonia herrerae]
VNTEERLEPKWLGKTNFVEIRSFCHILRSFDRMWSFLILALQAMIIMATHDLESPLQVFDSTILEDITSIFITSAVLKLLQGVVKENYFPKITNVWKFPGLAAILDIVFTWKARCTMDSTRSKKYVLKVVVAVIWTIVLPVLYASSRKKYTCYSTQKGSWLGEWCYSSYMVAVTLYLLTNSVNMVLFFVPAVGRYIETSNFRICALLSWWSQIIVMPRLYVGRGMQESQLSILKYTVFWVLLLLSKFSFSYNFEIKPLIAPTRQIMQIGVKNYDWHELFPKVFGGLYGVLHHLGEIRTLGMLRSRFHALPSAFTACLIAPPSRKDKHRRRKWFFRKRFKKVPETEKNGATKFVLIWNQIITSFREEDLISNREVDLMKIPPPSEFLSGLVRWPVFLLADKVAIALSIAKDFVGKDSTLLKKIKKDDYMYFAVKECYESLKCILEVLVVGDLERRETAIISGIVDEIEESIGKSSLLEDFKMGELPALHAKCVDLVELLLFKSFSPLTRLFVSKVEGNEEHHDKVVIALQDVFELVTNDMMLNGSRFCCTLNLLSYFDQLKVFTLLNVTFNACRTLDSLYAYQHVAGDAGEFFSQIEPQLFASKHSIHFPLPDSNPLNQQIKRFVLLLNVKDTALDIPLNLEARRRISFFATSLFMDIPCAPKVCDMLSFSVLTPHLKEEVKFSTEELHSSKEEVSIIFYMQKIFPDEWKFFLERTGNEKFDNLNNEIKEEVRDWASFRGQTLSRTVRGMMYYRQALKLQAFLDMAEDDDILQGYDTIQRGNDSLSAQLDALVDLKFTHIVSCQMFGSQKSSRHPQAQDILDLMIRYPSLRVAYVEEKEEILADKPRKVYSSILVKAVNDLDQELYRIKLPGPPNIGEGKPENQNHAIIFTCGEALQAIDMNQENYMEEALKMRNVLQEFQRNKGRQPPTILGLREHIFTGRFLCCLIICCVSSLAWFMSYQEASFVTIGQKILANPLRVRFHYGHPDLFDRVFQLTRGGISKASKTINISEDVFAVGKGRDVGLNQISKFEAKIANGNSEQTLSRDIYRLGRWFDFFRMLSCYFTTIGFYINSLLSVISIYVFLYGQLYLVLSGLEKAIVVEARIQNIESLETALASQSFILLGLLTGLPMVMEIGLERGFPIALKDFVLMQLQLASVFFTFSLGTKTHYYGRTMLHGGAKYRPTRRKVVVFHASFTENYRLYSRSHFMKGFELLLLLIVYDLFRRSYQSSMAYVLITCAIWFLSLTWLFAPFLFNPSGFNWGKIVDDWKVGTSGSSSRDKSWQSWWNDEQAHLRHSGLCSRLIEILLSLRFFIYQYGLVYHLDISHRNKNFIVYVLSWVVIIMIFLLVKDLTVCCLAFLPTGWGLILVAQALRPKIEATGLWDFVEVFAQAYDYGMGVVLFAPIASLAWLPIISAFQTRFLFNEAYSRGVQIQPILPGKKKHK